MEVDITVLTTTSLFTDRLSFEELLSFATHVQCGGDCRQQPWYSKVRGLFPPNSSVVHQHTAAAIDELLMHRMTAPVAAEKEE